MMNGVGWRSGPGWDAKCLAIASLGTFWAIPFSPLVAWAALRRTEHANDWTRPLAVSAAILCAVYTVAIAVWVTGLGVYVLAGGRLV